MYNSGEKNVTGARIINDGAWNGCDISIKINIRDLIELLTIGSAVENAVYNLKLLPRYFRAG